MPELKSADGRYLAADQGDGNFAVYDLTRPFPNDCWDRWSYEAGQPMPAPHHAPPDWSPAPTPTPLPNRQPIRVTDERDGELVPRGYSYWSQAWISGSGLVYVFAGHADGNTRFFSIDLTSRAVHRHGSPVPYVSTGEGWYYDASGWVYFCRGPQLHHVDPLSGVDAVIIDIRDSYPNCDLWQAHSSDDGRTHSATVRRIVNDGAWPKIGTLLQHDDQQTFYPAIGVLDESAVTPDASHLVIKEDDDNFIVPLNSPQQAYWIRDHERAAGHSDCGPGMLVGEADKPDPGACVVWDLHARRMRVLFETWNMGYVSVRGGRCLWSNDTHLSLVALDGSGITPLVPHGNTGSDYDDRVKAAFDPTGRVATYMSNVAGRRDVFLLEIP